MWFFLCNKKQEVVSPKVQCPNLSLSSKDVIVIPMFRDVIKKQILRHTQLLQFEREVFSLMNRFDKKITETLFTFFTSYNMKVPMERRVKMQCFQLLFPCNEILLKDHITSMFEDIDDLYVTIIGEFFQVKQRIL